MANIRKFKTTSGATGVQVCYKEGNQVVKTVHVGSASSEKGISKLVREARKIIDAEKGTAMFNLERFNRKVEGKLGNQSNTIRKMRDSGTR